MRGAWAARGGGDDEDAEPQAVAARRRRDIERKCMVPMTRAAAAGCGQYGASMILLICGSVRVGSVNAAVLRTVAELADAQLYEGLAALPMFDPDRDVDPLPAAVVALRTAIARADALLFSTPEYAGALPGALKNLLEWTVGGTEIGGKPTGWINPSTGPTGAAGTYEQLATVLRYTDAAIVPAACARIPVTRADVVDGLIVDGRIRAQLAACIAAFAHAAPAA